MKSVKFFALCFARAQEKCQNYATKVVGQQATHIYLANKRPLRLIKGFEVGSQRVPTNVNLR